MESIQFACVYLLDVNSGWLEVLPKGVKADDSIGYWHDQLQAHGAWQSHPSAVTDAMYSSFDPKLLQPDGQPDVLVMTRDWYQEMKNDPTTIK